MTQRHMKGGLMWKWTIICLMLPAALLAGCGSVRTVQPLPQAILSADEQARFTGTWAIHGQAGYVRLDDDTPYMVSFDCAGVAHVAAVDLKDGHFNLVQAVVVIAKGKHSYANSGFLSFPDEIAGHPSAYPFVRYTFLSPTDLLIWGPDPAPFEEAIKAGRLKGTANKSQKAETFTTIFTEITSTPQEVLDFLDDPATPHLFDRGPPLLFTKVIGTPGSRASCGK